MLPVSGMQKVQAAPEGYPVKYQISGDYAEISEMADNYYDFISQDGTLEIPSQIEGKAVRLRAVY